MRNVATQALLIVVGLAGACHPSLGQSTGAADDLARRVVSALAANDQAALDKMSIDQSEFKKYVWPTLAAQMSGSNISADKYYATYQKVNQVGVTEATTELVGKEWDVVRVSLEPARKKGKEYQLFGSPLITLRDDSGQEKSVRLIGGILELNGALKVTSFYVSPSLKASK